MHGACLAAARSIRPTDAVARSDKRSVLVTDAPICGWRCKITLRRRLHLLLSDYGYVDVSPQLSLAAECSDRLTFVAQQQHKSELLRIVLHYAWTSAVTRRRDRAESGSDSERGTMRAHS